MQKHTKIYLRHFGYSQLDYEYIPCEGCGGNTIDIHHLLPRSLGGGNDIENLCAVCRVCHDRAGKFPSWNEYLKIKHLKYLIDYDSA